jgi:hypothetical protein
LLAAAFNVFLPLHYLQLSSDCLNHYNIQDLKIVV